jgi:hypothetical protein
LALICHSAVDEGIHGLFDRLVVRTRESKRRPVRAASEGVQRQRHHEVAVPVGVEAGFVHAVQNVGRGGAQAGLVGRVGAGVALRRIVRVAAGALLEQGEHRQAVGIAG